MFKRTAKLGVASRRAPNAVREWLLLSLCEEKRKVPTRRRDFKVLPSTEEEEIQNCASIAKANFNTRVLCYRRRVCPALLHKGHTSLLIVMWLTL